MVWEVPELSEEPLHVTYPDLHQSVAGVNFHDNSYQACNEDITYIFLAGYLIFSSF